MKDNDIDLDTSSMTLEEKIEAERNEWKALSAIRRYVRANAKKLSSLSGKKLDRRISKLQKMGYEIEFMMDGDTMIPCGIGYNFRFDVKMSAPKKIKKVEEIVEEKPKKSKNKIKKEKEKEEEKQEIKKLEVKPKKEKKLKNKEEKEESEVLIPEVLDEEEEPKKVVSVEILAGDTFKDETTIDVESIEEDEDENEESRYDDLDDDSRDYDGGGFGSSEHEDYRNEMFCEMENGNWD